MTYFISLLLTLSALFGGHAQAPSQAPTEAPSQAASQAPAQAPVAYNGDTEEVPTDWVGQTLWENDMELPPNVFVVLTNDLNCGAQASAQGLGGCTYTLSEGRYYVTVSPELAWTPEGNHVLMHELGHVLNGPDECTAEYYAAQFDSVEMWSYPECAK